jgi:hypothetical protein
MANLTILAPNFAKIAQESGDATRDAIRLLWLKLGATANPQPAETADTADTNAFGVVAAPDQPSLLADSPSDTLTIVGNGIAVELDPLVDKLTLTVEPGQPNTSVQFNRDNTFGGNEAFEFHEDSTTVTVGTGHTPGGADNLLVGEGHTVN